VANIKFGEDDMIELTDKPIDPKVVFEHLSRYGAGSMVVHVGVVKPKVDGKKTGGIKFEKAGELEAELEQVEKELRKKWGVTDAIIIKRIGNLKVGDAIMAAGFVAETRDPAFGACRDSVEMLKKLKNVKKTELFE